MSRTFVLEHAKFRRNLSVLSIKIRGGEINWLKRGTLLEVGLF